MEITVINGFHGPQKAELTIAKEENENKDDYGFYYIFLELIDCRTTFSPYTYYSIAKLLRIPVRDYYNMLMKNKAFQIRENHYFEYKKDVKKAYDEIEAYLILNKLIE